MISLAKREAANSGADVLKITTHDTPNLWSTCHRIKADFYKSIEAQNDSTTVPDIAMADDYGGEVISTPATVGPAASNDKKLAPWRFAFSGGYSNRLAEVADLNNEFLEEYLKKLKNGYHLSAEFGVNVNAGLNLGIRVDQMRSNHSAMVTLEPDDPNEPTQSGILKDDIRISFIGAQMLFRAPFKNQKAEVLFGVSIGYLGYRNEGELIDERITTTGSTLSLRLDAGLDIKVHDAIALGINLGFSTGTLSKLNVETDSGSYTFEAEAGEGESLLRLDLGGGIRFVFCLGIRLLILGVSLKAMDLMFGPCRRWHQVNVAGYPSCNVLRKDASAQRIFSPPFNFCAHPSESILRMKG